MDPLIIGQHIEKKANEETEYHGPWMSRRGDKATYGVELLFAGLSDFKLRVFTKDSEDADPGTQLGSDTTIGSTPGIINVTLSGAQEWVRYVVFAANNANTGSMVFRFLEPQWADN